MAQGTHKFRPLNTSRLYNSALAFEKKTLNKVQDVFSIHFFFSSKYIHRFVFLFFFFFFFKITKLLVHSIYQLSSKLVLRQFKVQVQYSFPLCVCKAFIVNSKQIVSSRERVCVFALFFSFSLTNTRTHTDRKSTFSNFTWRSGPISGIGLKAATEKHINGTLDLCVSVGINDGVDHGVVSCWQQRSISIH